MEGYVYILMNPAFPDLVKIGRTSKSPQARATELSNTGTPNKFIVVHSVFTRDCISLEDQLHREFDEHRYNKDREFFCVTPVQVIKKIEELLGSVDEENALNVDEIDFDVFIYQAVLDKCGSVRIGFLDKADKYFINTVDGPRECSLNTYLYSEDFKITLFEYYSQLDWKPSLILSDIQVLRYQEFVVSKLDFEYCKNIGLPSLIHDLFSSESMQREFSNINFLSDSELNEASLPIISAQIFIDGKTLKIDQKSDKYDEITKIFYLSCVRFLESMQGRFKSNKLKMQEQKYKEIIRDKINTFPNKV